MYKSPDHRYGNCTKLDCNKCKSAIRQVIVVSEGKHLQFGCIVSMIEYITKDPFFDFFAYRWLYPEEELRRAIDARKLADKNKKN